MLLSDPFARPLHPGLWEFGLLWAMPQSGIEFLLGILCWCCEIRAWLSFGISSGDKTGQGSILGWPAQPSWMWNSQEYSLLPNPGACGQLPSGQGAPDQSCCRNDLSRQEWGIVPWVCPKAGAAPALHFQGEGGRLGRPSLGCAPEIPPGWETCRAAAKGWIWLCNWNLFNSWVL